MAAEEVKEIADPSYSIISFKASQLPQTYIPFIFAKWLRSLRVGNNLFRKIDSVEYFKNYHAYIEKLLAKPDSLIKLAVLSDDHDVALGFSASREDVLDYVFVHYDYRKLGIGTLLIPAGITAFTHLTLPGIDIWQTNEKYKKWKFNPFA